MEIVLDDGNFGSIVLESSGAVMVDFWAEWCGPCKMLAPVIGEIAKEYEGKVKVCKLDVEKGPETAKKYGVMNIPTVIFFKDGEVVDKIVGLAAKNDIISKINRYI
ncbi:MAG: thioredoxin [Candidatus Omnitrophica bacterium]|nr:thioredoxin [Candidatus Omnitrophota bacterium]